MQLFTLAALLVVASGAPVLNTPFRENYYADTGFKLAGQSNPTDPVVFTIALKQRNIDDLKRVALAVNTPGHAKYGQFLKQKEIDDLTLPLPNSFEAVETWLTNHKAEYTVQQENILVSTTVKVASKLLSTRFVAIQRRGTSLTRAVPGYTLPAQVAPHVQSILGLHGLPLPQQSCSPLVMRETGVKGGQPPSVTPAVIESTYSIKQEVDRSGKNHQSVAEFQSQYMSKADLSTFFKNEVPDAQSGDDQISKFVGSPYQEGDSVEADLDSQFIMGVAPGVKTEFWSWQANDFCKDLHSYTSQMLTGDDAPLVNSISYGWQGALSQLGCQNSDIQAVDVNWAKIAAKGISILISSGDTGCGYIPPSGGSCPTQKLFTNITSGTVLKSIKANNADDCCDAGRSAKAKGFTFVGKLFSQGKCVLYSDVKSTGSVKTFMTAGTIPDGPGSLPEFWPSWPASSPWVTAVGATRFIDQTVKADNEMASDQFGSGGGFSKHFNQSDAAWQIDMVKAYVAKGESGSLPKFPPKGSFPSNGRATPDVAALGEGFKVYTGGNPQPVGGTSASAPTFAGLVSLLNEARLKAGKPAMGFLNPFMYQNPSAFFDVVEGTNAIGRGTGDFPNGFACTEGWDAATGLGTPHYPALLAAAMAAVGM